MDDAEIIRHLIKGLPSSTAKDIYMRSPKTPKDVLNQLIELARFESLIGKSSRQEVHHLITKAVQSALENAHIDDMQYDATSDCKQEDVNATQGFKKKPKYKPKTNPNQTWYSGGYKPNATGAKGKPNNGGKSFSSFQGQRQPFQQRPPYQGQSNSRGRGFTPSPQNQNRTHCPCHKCRFYNQYHSKGVNNVEEHEEEQECIALNEQQASAPDAETEYYPDDPNQQ